MFMPLGKNKKVHFLEVGVMLFNSVAFAIFLPIVFIVYWALPHKFRWPLLLIASYYFYMSWNAKYVVLILFTTVLSYIAGILVEKYESAKIKKSILLITLIACLGVLFFFKYFNFAFDSLTSLLRLFSIQLNPVTLNVILPVGISFYTFQTLSYVIDVYRGEVKAEKNFGIYATFISFFPQLVAGPIERTSNLLPQIKSKKQFNYDNATYGLKLMAWGYFKKMAVADVLATYVDKVYSNLGSMTGFDYAMAIVFFTIQIYCDFSGYSDIAIGTAKILGIDLMTNFRSPYFSKSIKEFWSRWHISLSSWFKDYVYIPLGGNRCKRSRSYLNLLITFLVSGLWHGANWTFVMWGGVHGVLQIIEKQCDGALKKFRGKNKITKWIAVVIIFVICNLAWVLFRADNLHDALFVVYHAVVDLKNPSLYFHSNCGIGKSVLLKITATFMLLGVYDYFSLQTDVIKWVSNQKLIIRWSIYVILILMIMINSPVNNQAAFIYFQF